jgi:protein SCO1
VSASPTPPGANALLLAIGRIEALRAAPGNAPALVELLPPDSPIYAGLGRGEAERLRGYAMAGLEGAQLPAHALASLFEELETGLNPYLVAAAAKAVRGAATPPGDAAALLLRAIQRIRRTDEIVAFDRFDAFVHDPAHGPPVTALMELMRTLAWLGAQARGSIEAMKAMKAAGGFSPAVAAELDAAVEAVSAAAPLPCCAKTPAWPAVPLPQADLGAIELQDQDGAVASFAEAFYGRPTVLAFFYTRCMNPEKCPLTVAKLGRLQRRLAAEALEDEVNLAAITYDPAFDLPWRLRRYGTLLGLNFDARTRLWRTTGPFEPLRSGLDLGVGYGPATVNQHRIELFVLDEAGRVAEAILRRLWDEEEVLAALRRLAREAVGP